MNRHTHVSFWFIIMISWQKKKKSAERKWHEYAFFTAHIYSLNVFSWIKIYFLKSNNFLLKKQIFSEFYLLFDEISREISKWISEMRKSNNCQTFLISVCLSDIILLIAYFSFIYTHTRKSTRGKMYLFLSVHLNETMNCGKVKIKSNSSDLNGIWSLCVCFDDVGWPFQSKTKNWL